MYLRKSLFCALALVGLMATTGCTYMRNRGNDFSEIIDAGVTVSPEPQFSLYAGFLTVFSLGYSNMDGVFYGLQKGDWGAYEARHDAVGLLLYGWEEFAYEPRPALLQPSDEPWGTGFGLISRRAAEPNQFMNCPKMLHFGPVGITVNCKFVEIVDFLVGLTTIDIVGDDE